MESKRGGRVQVNLLQFKELTVRVEALEKIVLALQSENLTHEEIEDAIDDLTENDQIEGNIEEADNAEKTERN